MRLPWVDYRKRFLDSLVRGGEEEAKQAEANYEKARTQSDRDYEEAAGAVATKKQLTADEEAELTRLWKKLVKLYHPDRFANEPDKLETYVKLTAAINRAKDNGDVATYDTLKIARAACADKGEVLVLKTDGDPQRSSAYECRKKP